MNHLIRTRNLTKRFTRRTALDGRDISTGGTR
jgi:hypothetical protein